VNSIEKMMERLAQQKLEKSDAGSKLPLDPVLDPVAPKAVQKVANSQVVKGPSDYSEIVQPANRQMLKVQLEHLAAAGYLPDDYEDSTQFREFRRIKRPILKKAFFAENAKDALPKNLVMISSALPGEGKTFCAINLTLNMILERDITVMLMDVDCIRRSLSRLFGLENSPGLIDVLVGESEMEAVIVNTSIPQLKILPAGRPHKHVPELLAGDRMKQLMPEIAKRYADRLVLMDTPPLLAGNDAEIISHYTGQALIVVEAGITSQSIIQEALTQIDTTKTETGLMLNKRQGSGLGVAGYGYYENYSSGVSDAGNR